jgi:hypothetical protein
MDLARVALGISIFEESPVKRTAGIATSQASAAIYRTDQCKQHRQSQQVRADVAGSSSSLVSNEFGHSVVSEITQRTKPKQDPRFGVERGKQSDLATGRSSGEFADFRGKSQRETQRDPIYRLTAGSVAFVTPNLVSVHHSE